MEAVRTLRISLNSNLAAVATHLLHLKQMQLVQQQQQRPPFTPPVTRPLPTPTASPQQLGFATGLDAIKPPPATTPMTLEQRERARINLELAKKRRLEATTAPAPPPAAAAETATAPAPLSVSPGVTLAFKSPRRSSGSNAPGVRYPM